ncbi:hypothetical protein GEM21_05435 [Salmonella enterica]|nr:hypothetical protein [Salmonella enterica]EEO2148455.1 hypothetical protein [Salmonella enterica]EIL8912091.1 hypothetical protein [Salmonella enterica]
MAIPSFNNSSYNGQFLLDDSQYQPTQSDVLGRYRNPTPTDQGLPNVDPQNDLRNSLDVKQQQAQANFDTLGAHDTEGKIVGKDGMILKTAPDSRKDQLITGLIAFGQSFLAGENAGQSLQRAGAAVSDHISMIKRQNLAPELINKGYATVDIQKYIETGNTTDLLTNKGKYVPVDGGYINTLQGDFVPTAQQQSNLPNGLHVGINQTENGPVSVSQNAKGQYEVKPATKGEYEASQAAAQDQGGSDGTDSLNNSNYVGFRTGNNNKPIESGQFDQNGNPLYFGADNKSLVDASGNVYTGQTSNEISQKKEVTQQKTSEAAQSQIDLIDQSINTLNKLKNSKGFTSIYGSVEGRLPNISDSANDAAALRDQLSGQAFLQARSYLKGQGAITDFESQKAEAALTLLNNPRISNDQARKAANEYLEILNKGKKNLQAKQGGNQSAPAGGVTVHKRWNPTTQQLEDVAQ